MFGIISEVRQRGKPIVVIGDLNAKADLVYDTEGRRNAAGRALDMHLEDGDMVCVNDGKHTLIYYLPPALCEDEIQATQAVDTLREELQDELADKVLPTCRLVMLYPQFIEKIALLEAGLDDRIVEYAKYILLQNSHDISHDDYELLYDFSGENPDALTFIAYDRESHKAEYGLEFEKDDFDELVHFFAEAREAEGKLEELFPDYTVNVGLLLDYAAESE